MPHYIHVDFQLEYSLVRIHEKLWGRYEALLKAIKKTNPQYQPTYASQYDKLPQSQGVDHQPFRTIKDHSSRITHD